tara:strand:+ start:40 stop:1011 length:972 start_codon:yes stop_codon:yes gene_type:complete
MSCVIVTGGYGFIGSNFIKHLFDNTDDIIYNIDSLTYAADQKNIPEKIRESGRYNSIVADISQVNFIDPWNSFTTLLRKTKTIYHFAAESHVDNSITGPSIFVDTNVKGTFNLLEAAKKFDIEFVHVSTDEVYGTLGFFDDPFTEDTNIDPSSVYSASKAGSDLLVKAYSTTYGVKTTTTRCCNNYGPRQHVEKLLPKVITNALNDEKIPVYGKGENVREWIYVDDHCSGILAAQKANKEVHNVFNIGSDVEISNIDLVEKVLAITGKSSKLIEYVTDRPGHDLRYAMNSSKLRKASNWEPEFNYENFERGLEKTVEWYSSEG